ncbi:PCP degradation transcriptional activation protein [Paraburkholderia hiiakae]|uniref:PCP degradation transcriptional activation protein n=1 Tax=Paraburkholderia hiiakae TaxID=1081782 RepID=A0ABN7IFY4_9BURK|nr:LysR family transcriptional regulator [Paraburkholderia hiiakae]CAD6562075.1 PCP degradation transcriptional activation protein [Paraburkholderia hiiakae]
MKNVHSGIDHLDFLLVIEAVLAHRTITRAAQALDVSQSALSHTLTRLRERLGDPLFVRVGGEMQPTPLVARLADPIGRSLRIIRDEVLSAPEFDPATTTRVYNICVGEVGAFVIVPRVVRLLRERAPHARVVVLDLARHEIGSALEDGRLDVVIGYYPELKTSIYQQLLFTRTFVGIVRDDNPHIGQRLTLRQLRSVSIVRSPGTNAINRWLDSKLSGADRADIVMEMPYVMALAPILAETDWMGIVTEELVPAFRKLAPLRPVDLPTDLPRISVRQHWHRRFKDDVPNRFIRQVVYDAINKP